jgi:AcrR family transcriptional regulator
MVSQTDRSSGTRGRILAATRELLSSRAWADTSIDDVVRAAGVTKGALYHHFADKTAVLRALYEAEEQGVVDRLVASASRRQDPFDALRAGCHEFLGICLDDSFRRIALIAAPAALGWEEWRAIDAQYGFGLLRGGVEAALAAGRMRPLPVDHVSHLLLACLMEAALLLGQSDQPKRELAKLVKTLDAFLDALELPMA